ncbi:hypothetical protein [Spirosoma gilvum]
MTRVVLTPFDLFEIQTLFEEMCILAGICLKGLLLNADTGFDTDGFRLAEAQGIVLNVRPNPRNSSSVAYEPG